MVYLNKSKLSKQENPCWRKKTSNLYLYLYFAINSFILHLVLVKFSKSYKDTRVARHFLSVCMAWGLINQGVRFSWKTGLSILMMMLPHPGEKPAVLDQSAIIWTSWRCVGEDGEDGLDGQDSSVSCAIQGSQWFQVVC